MHDCATAFGAINNGDVFLDAIVGFHFETPPIGPERAANIVFGQFGGNFVGFYTVVKGSYLVAKLIRHIQYGHHFIGPVAMHVHQDLFRSRLGALASSLPSATFFS